MLKSLKSIRLIIRELGRLNTRLKSNNSSLNDEVLIEKLAEVIANHHTKISKK